VNKNLKLNEKINYLLHLLLDLLATEYESKM